MKPEAYCGPQISLTADNRITRHTLVTMAIGIAERKTAARLSLVVLTQ